MKLLKITEFAKEVRQEVARVTWPSRKETLVTAAMVFILAMLASVFFLVVDLSLSQLINWLLRLGA